MPGGAVAGGVGARGGGTRGRGSRRGCAGAPPAALAQHMAAADQGAPVGRDRADRDGT